MKKSIQSGISLFIILIISTSIFGQHLGSFDLLTNPISWSQETANIGGQVFIYPKFALYGAIENQKQSFEINDLSGQFQKKQWNGSIRFYPFGTRNITLFHDAYGPNSKRMKRKYNKKYGCETMQGFRNNNPFSFAQGLFLGAGFENQQEFYSMKMDEVMGNEEKVGFNRKKLTGAIGYHLRIENVSFNIHYKAAYGKVQAEGDNSIFESVLETSKPVAFQELSHAWQVQVGFNF